MSWAGDYATASSRAREAGKDIDLRYFVPEEGGLLWVDIVVIPKDAKNIENAYFAPRSIFRLKKNFEPKKCIFRTEKNAFSDRKMQLDRQM